MLIHRFLPKVTTYTNNSTLNNRYFFTVCRIKTKERELFHSCVAKGTQGYSRINKKRLQLYLLIYIPVQDSNLFIFAVRGAAGGKLHIIEVRNKMFS